MQRHSGLRLAWAILFLLHTASAQNTTPSVADLISSIPNCSLPCILDGFQQGGCSFDNLASCLCTNVALQSEISKCTQLSCEFQYQVATANVSNALCVSFPIPSRQHEVKLTSVIALGISIPIIALRCYSRYSTTRQLWWDDWTALLATAFFVVLAGIEISSANFGFGLHYWNVDPAKGRKILQLFYAVQILYVAVQVAAKVSILAFFSRIFPARWFKLTVWSFAAFLVGHGVIFILLVAFQCIPVFAIWDRTPRKCLDITAVGYAGAAFSIFEDIFILFLPIPELLKLQMGIQQKVSLILLFSVGSFACVTSMVRLKFLVNFASTFDTTWDNVDIVVWSIIEELSAILCCSLPALKPLFQKVPGIFSTIRSTQNQSTSRTDIKSDFSSRLGSERLSGNKFQKLHDLHDHGEGGQGLSSREKATDVVELERDSIPMNNLREGRPPV